LKARSASKTFPGLNLTSWDAAEEYVRESNRTGKVGGTTAKPMLIADAVELYLTDVQARLRSSTVRLHRVLLRDSLLVWCENKGYRYLSELDVKTLIEYRSSWQFAPLTALKKFERLRSFFRFCHMAKWMEENPTLAIKAPKADTPPTLPFTNEEVDRTLAAAKTFRISGSYGRTKPHPCWPCSRPTGGAVDELPKHAQRLIGLVPASSVCDEDFGRSARMGRSLRAQHHQSPGQSHVSRPQYVPSPAKLRNFRESGMLCFL